MADEPEQQKVIEKKEVTMVIPVLKAPEWLQGFVDFIREQGVVGLAIGLVLGTQIKVLVDQVVTSFINPLVGLILPGQGTLADKSFHLSLNGKVANFTWGAFAGQLISFITVAFIVYFTVKALKLDKLDKPKAKDTKAK